MLVGQGLACRTQNYKNEGIQKKNCATIHLLPKFRECTRVLVFARVDLRVVPLLWARTWILQPVVGVGLEKCGSPPNLV